jgi:malonyl-CoA O-methyltransferase
MSSLSFPEMWLLRKPKPAPERAMEWFKANMVEGKGVIVNSRQRVPYPEVTGYFVPTLYEWGEVDLARACTAWLISIQLPDGAFPAPDGVPYTFDTAKVMRGLCAAHARGEPVEAALASAADWMVTQVRPDGRLATPSTALWGAIANDLIHIYAIAPLIDAGRLLRRPAYEEAGRLALAYYKRQDGLLPFNRLSHFHAYAMEALVELGETTLARRGMADVERLQRKDGSIPAYPDVDWICSTGIAQYAGVWYRLGVRDRADRAMTYLKRIQNDGGGFFGSRGPGADYMPNAEISWAVKYFLDAHRLKLAHA